MSESLLVGSSGVTKLTGLSRKTVRKWTLEGIIPYAVQLKSGRYRYHLDAINAWWKEAGQYQKGGKS
jgi:predicted DNA-binding transcriptional regulator AlpA